MLLNRRFFEHVRKLCPFLVVALLDLLGCCFKISLIHDVVVVEY